MRTTTGNLRANGGSLSHEKSKRDREGEGEISSSNDDLVIVDEGHLVLVDDKSRPEQLREGGRARGLAYFLFASKDILSRTTSNASH